MARKFHGEVLEKHIIAQGAFGVVEKIKFKSDPEKYIACKTIISDTDNGSTKEVIEREYKILSFLNHPNIVRYEWFEWLQNPPGAKLYMEYCEGGNLDTYIKKRNSSKENTSEEFVWKLVAQLASALMYCHHGVTTANEPINPKWGRILHRDIKPGNVFLAGDSNVDVQVKLGDFGLGVILQDGNADTYVGTKQYLAPEINRAESEISWSEKCDIFSLGCTLYALCNGSTPFDYRMDSPNEIKPEAFSEEYSPTLRDFTIECLSFKPEARPDAIKIHTIAEDQLSTIGPPGGYRPPQALVAHGKGHLLPGAPIAATSWPGWHFRVYFQDSSGGIREAKHDMGEWTGGDTKSVICHARLFTPLAVVSSSTGKEIRLFYLNENNTLQEHYYSTISGWRSGSLNKLKIKASPQSRITALWLPAGVRVFYQEPTKNALQEYYMDTGTTWWKRLRWSRGTWRKGKTLSANALKGTSLASATWGGGSMRLYYQDTTLELREHCCDGPSRGWYVGHLAAGTIPKYSPISSFAWSGQHNGVQVRVYWHDKSKNLVELSWDGGWQPVKEVLFMGTTQFCAVQWDNGSHIRAYHQGSDHAIMEKCFSNTGDWYNGTRVDHGAQD